MGNKNEKSDSGVSFLASIYSFANHPINLIRFSQDFYVLFHLKKFLFFFLIFYFSYFVGIRLD